jgi:sugar O-acyltransferase (sialic acid O-acetyltransferase NeuD family)
MNEFNKINNLSDKPICIIGTGGFGREIFCIIHELFKQNEIEINNNVIFSVNKSFQSNTEIMGIAVINLEDIDYSKYQFIISIGDPKKRKELFSTLPPNIDFATIVHPQVVISPWVKIGKGSVICPGCILTCNIEIGEHAHLNLHTTVGHDTTIGNFFTSAPGVKISGNCVFEEEVYLGTNASIKEKINICSQTTIGMGASVTKSISEPGIYVGIPAKKLDLR